MSQVFNIYCDESCHLENDKQPVMVLGAVWCPTDRSREITKRLRDIKIKHGLSANFELKWSKVSPAKTDMYLDFINYFFDNDDLHFRALIATKIGLRHDDFKQTHDEWYYKMYFEMLKVLFSPDSRYRVYLDFKDTRGSEKVAKLHEVLSNKMYDFSKSIIEWIQVIHSHESQIIQLVDLLIGTVSYANRELSGNAGKEALVEVTRKKSGYNLTQTTSYQEEKVNLFRWSPSEAKE